MAAAGREFLAPRLGGGPEAWAQANRVVFERSWQRYLEALDLAADVYSDHLAFFWEVERERWLREMCEHVGVAAPAGAACLRLAEETEAYVRPRVQAAIRSLADLPATLAR